jgi:anti-anti-sigma factor
MGIQNWSNATLLVDLPGAPEVQAELEEVARLVRDRGDCDVVMDFSAVTLLNSSCLATLLRLRKQLLDRGRRLVLCNIGRVTHGILSVTGLTGVFEIRADRSDALATVTLLETATESPCALEAEEARQRGGL